jgi:phospholipid/cholesterol/gamma-HCH transport system permease protein
MAVESKTAADEPQVERSLNRDGKPQVRLSGAWVLPSLLPRAAQLHRQLLRYAQEVDVHWDLRDIGTLDTAGALLLWRSWGRREPQWILFAEHEPAFANLSSEPPPSPRRRPRDPLTPIAALRRDLLSLGEHATQLALLAGLLVLDLFELTRHPLHIPWSEISANVHQTGARALPIVALVGLLVGVVLSYLSGRELQVYGADTYIVNILGIGVMRELGPMLAAILVAGRSGASVTAQLGVMRVTEELDALSVMGISQTRRLVLPKVIALAITLPLLVLWCDATALIGGMLAANWQLGIDYQQFLHDLPSVVPISNLWLGIGKGVLFGILIALIACHYGLRINPNTESLGTGTTDSVVASITVVILVDAAIAVMFSSMGF